MNTSARVALVTGSTSGIGAAIARRLSNDGFRVIVHSRSSSEAGQALAKELSVPVVALSQLSRAPESRGGDHRPQLSDLRESGSIEQDAAIVMFIFREEVYRQDDPELQGKAEIIIAKQRNGPTGRIRLAFLKPCTRFETLADGGVAPEE